MKKIFKIAGPSIVSNITVPLLGAVDVAITGHIGDARYMAAIAVGAMMFNLVYWLFGFLRMGTSGLTSQALGARNLDETTRLLTRAIAVAEGIALLFIVLQWPLRETLIWLMGPEDEVKSLARRYFCICIWGAPAVMGLYGMNGWLIGMQNTRTPMVVAIVQNVVNIIASLFLVFVVGMKIEGVATGTLIAQWTGLIMAVGMTRHGYGRLFARHPATKDRAMLFDRKKMGEFFRVNRDLFLRTCFLVGVNFFFTAAGARQGAEILAVNTVLMQFFLFFSYFMDGFANAGEALAGRYYGAGNATMLRQTIGRLFAWGAITTATFTAVYLAFGNGIVGLLTDNADVIAAARPYQFWTIVIPVVGVSAFVWDGVFIGLTMSRGMLGSSVVAALAFFATFFINSHLKLLPENHALWLAQVVYLAMRGITQSWIYARREPTLFRAH